MSVGQKLVYYTLLLNDTNGKKLLTIYDIDFVTAIAASKIGLNNKIFKRDYLKAKDILRSLKEHI